METLKDLSKVELMAIRNSFTDVRDEALDRNRQAPAAFYNEIAIIADDELRDREAVMNHLEAEMSKNEGEKLDDEWTSEA